MLVTFPRSGQTILRNVLKNLCIKHKIDYSYCEFYGCCSKIPCEKGYMFQKNHDFNSDLPIIKNLKYVVMYRKDVILQLEAYYRFSIKKTPEKYNYNSLLEFIKMQKPYYDKFVEKWINNKNENILKLEYYDYISNPVKYSRMLFCHVLPNVNKKITIDESDLEVMVPELGKKTNIKVLNIMDPAIYDRLCEDLEI